MFHEYFRFRTSIYDIRYLGLDTTYGRTNYGLIMVKNTAARVWNSVDEDIRKKSSQLNFRKIIATYYIKKYNKFTNF